nr:hypothetical protein [Nitrosomonas sp.]
PQDEALYRELILTKQFIPAGNTLLAGVDPVRPNCCILPSVTEANFDEMAARAAVLWADRIGIGFDLSDAEDPISILKCLSTINANIKLDHRPQRGNMAVLKSSHPKILEFINVKSAEFSTGSSVTNIYNFNLSVGINNSDQEMSKADQAIMTAIAQSAWVSGDPGIVFLDRVQGPMKESLMGQVKTRFILSIQNAYVLVPSRDCVKMKFAK